MTTTRAQVQLDTKEMRFPPCIARQPILTADKKVCAYELLFREGKEDYFFGQDPEGATRTTLHTSVLVGLDVLGDGHPAFINFTRDILQKEYVRLFPKEQIVVEILETVAGDEVVKVVVSAAKTCGVQNRSGRLRARRFPRVARSFCRLHQGGFQSGCLG